MQGREASRTYGQLVYQAENKDNLMSPRELLDVITKTVVLSDWKDFCQRDPVTFPPGGVWASYVYLLSLDPSHAHVPGHIFTT